MKKLWLMLVLVMFAFAGCAENDLALWGITTDGAGDMAQARLGVVIPVSDTNSVVEIGGTAKWNMKDPWNEDVDYGGAYVTFFPDLMVNVFDPSPNNIFGDMMGQLHARPYAGVEGLIPTHGRDRSVDVNWMLGTMVGIDPDMQTAITFEFTSGQAVLEDNDNLWLIGGRIRF